MKSKGLYVCLYVCVSLGLAGLGWAGLGWPRLGWPWTRLLCWDLPWTWPVVLGWPWAGLALG